MRDPHRSEPKNTNDKLMEAYQKGLAHGKIFSKEQEKLFSSFEESNKRREEAYKRSEEAYKEARASSEKTIKRIDKISSVLTTASVVVGIAATGLYVWNKFR